MKPCPICQIPHCEHEKKFFSFGLMKLIIIHKSIETTSSIFNRLVNFLPTNTEMQMKLSLAMENLKKASEQVNDVKKWCETKIA